VKNECRNADGRENVPDVDLFVHSVQRPEGPRARAVAQHLEEMLRLLVAERSECPNSFESLFARAENPQVALDLSLVILFRPAPGIVRRPQPSRKSAAHDERGRTLWICSREQDRHRRTFREAVERSPTRPDRVHDRANIVHTCLERGRSAHRIGHACAPFVEPNQPAERAEPLEKWPESQHLPVELKVGHVPGHENEIEGPVASDLVGDVHIATLRIPKFRHPHAESLAG